MTSTKTAKVIHIGDFLAQALARVEAVASRRKRLTITTLFAF
ncbi:MAG: hypothetical protein ABI298_05235 [Acidimicrobiales bacterium]